MVSSNAHLARSSSPSTEGPGSGPADQRRFTYGYDGDLLKTMTWSGSISGTIARTFDPDFRVATETVNGAWSASFGYDLDSLLTSAGPLTIARGATNGRVTGTTAGSVTDTYAYNKYGEVSGYTASYSGSPILAFTYARDDLGRIHTKTETEGGVTTTYVYDDDDVGRLNRSPRTAPSSKAEDSSPTRLPRASATKMPTRRASTSRCASSSSGASSASSGSRRSRARATSTRTRATCSATTRATALGARSLCVLLQSGTLRRLLRSRSPGLERALARGSLRHHRPGRRLRQRALRGELGGPIRLRLRHPRELGLRELRPGKRSRRHRCRHDLYPCEAHGYDAQHPDCGGGWMVCMGQSCPGSATRRRRSTARPCSTGGPSLFYGSPVRAPDPRTLCDEPGNGRCLLEPMRDRRASFLAARLGSATAADPWPTDVT